MFSRGWTVSDDSFSAKSRSVTILNRYILSIYFRIFALTLATFVGIYLLVEFFDKVDNFIEHGAAASSYLYYFGNKIPLIISQVIPLAVLMGVFMTLGGLSRTNELTAIRACGLSLLRITWPLILVSLITAITILLMNEFLVPLSARTVNHVLEEQVKGKKSMVFKKDKIWFREGANIININLADAKTNTVQGLTIFHVNDNFQLISRLDAPEGHYIEGQGWRFNRAIKRFFNPQTGELETLEKYTDTVIPLSRTPEDFKASEPDVDELSFRQLSAMVNAMEAEGYSPVRYKVDMQSRLSVPFANVIMAILGIPFALQRGRGSNLAAGVALSVAIGFSYHVLMAALQAFGYSGVLPPIVAAWSAHVLFLLVGAWMLLSTRQ